jgi:hypothetical protein
MAMWITRQRASPGPVFGSIDKFEGLGLFIDTYKNERPGVIFPYISAMIGMQTFSLSLSLSHGMELTGRGGP